MYICHMSELWYTGILKYSSFRLPWGVVFWRRLQHTLSPSFILPLCTPEASSTGHQCCSNRWTPNWCASNLFCALGPPSFDNQPALHFFKIFHLDVIMENMEKFACTDLSSWEAMIAIGFVDEYLTAMKTCSLFYELLHQIEICNRSLRVELFCSAPKRLWSVTMSPGIFPAEWGAAPCC